MIFLSQFLLQALGSLFGWSEEKCARTTHETYGMGWSCPED